jgi:hypothetical protein
MPPKGFTDSFFSPDYAGGLGVLFQKLNQVPYHAPTPSIPSAKLTVTLGLCSKRAITVFGKSAG